MRGTMLFDIGLMPVVWVVAFFRLVLPAKAMGVESLSRLESVVQELLEHIGRVPARRAPQAGSQLGPALRAGWPRRPKA
jgi:hypothetical protein